MITEKIADRVYFKSELLMRSERIVHFFTSKAGGCSKGGIEGLNLGFRVNDDIDSVKMNYKLISDDFKIPFESIVAAKQIHSTDIKIITEDEKGCGVSRHSEFFEADALVTDCTDIPIMVFYADCVPILLADTRRYVVAAIHSGWRGTVNQIASKAVEIMTSRFHSQPEDILAAIGPSIGKCCFETGSEVACEFDADLSVSLNNGKFKVDLWEANKRILLNAGIPEDNIDLFGLCTMCNSNLLYSYRTHREKVGRMGAMIMLKQG